MKTYDVHLFYAIRISVRGVLAESQEEAGLRALFASIKEELE